MTTIMSFYECFGVIALYLVTGIFKCVYLLAGST